MTLLLIYLKADEYLQIIIVLLKYKCAYEKELIEIKFIIPKNLLL